MAIIAFLVTCGAVFIAVGVAVGDLPLQAFTDYGLIVSAVIGIVLAVEKINDKLRR